MLIVYIFMYLYVFSMCLSAWGGLQACHRRFFPAKKRRFRILDYVKLARSLQNPQDHRKLIVALHEWIVGPICPDRYGPYLSFSSGTSQEMSLSKPLESTQSWRGEAAPTLA